MMRKPNLPIRFARSFAKWGVPSKIVDSIVKIGTSRPEDLVDHHFWVRDAWDHPNRQIVISAISALGGREALIFETGTSAWGFDSTRIWMTYVKRYGGSLTSVDIRPEPSISIGKTPENIHLLVQDSVSLIQDIASSRTPSSLDLVFLDSYDLDLRDPVPAMEHGLREFEAIAPLLRPGSLILIDDTPRETSFFGELAGLAAQHLEEYGILPGKGALALQKISESTRYEILDHQYAVLIRCL